MSCKKGDAFRCTGAGFRGSDTFASLHWDLHFQSGICSCKVASKAPFLWQVSGKTSILEKVRGSRNGRNHSKRQEKLPFWISWGKWRKSFFVAGAAHCRLEGWKRWFRCTCVAVTLGFAVTELCFRGVEKCCYIGICDVLGAWLATFGESLVWKCSFWKLGLSLLVKVSWKMLVLGAWIVNDCRFWWKSRRKNSFWKLGFCHVWWKSGGKCSFWKGLSLLVSLDCHFFFGESPAEKYLFWKLGLSLLVVKVSWKILVLEAWILTFGESLVESAGFGHFW